jgi:tetratricopeptide (TPR) repeat protein
VRLVINFIGNWSGSTYILKHPDDAKEKFKKCEIYLKKIIDFGILSNMLMEFNDAKREILEVTKKYKELKKAALDFMKMVKESIGVNNIDYAYACYDVGYVYGLLNEGELSVKYRLMCINTLHKLEQSDKVIRALSTHYGNLSGIYRNHLKDYKNAIICAQKCLDLKEKNNFEKNKSYGISLYKLGMSYGMNKEFKKSVDLMQQALPYFKENSSKEIYQKSVLELDLGIITNEFDKKTAEILLNKAIKKIESEDISIYITDQIKKRIEIGKNILNLND